MSICIIQHWYDFGLNIYSDQDLFQLGSDFWIESEFILPGFISTLIRIWIELDFFSMLIRFSNEPGFIPTGYIIFRPGFIELNKNIMRWVDIFFLTRNKCYQIRQIDSFCLRKTSQKIAIVVIHINDTFFVTLCMWAQKKNLFHRRLYSLVYCMNIEWFTFVWFKDCFLAAFIQYLCII